MIYTKCIQFTRYWIVLIVSFKLYLAKHSKTVLPLVKCMTSPRLPPPISLLIVEKALGVKPLAFVFLFLKHEKCIKLSKPFLFLLFYNNAT